MSEGSIDFNRSIPEDLQKRSSRAKFETFLGKCHWHHAHSTFVWRLFWFNFARKSQLLPKEGSDVLI
ncbi:hypothetical protein PsorP6_013400 [Peronosclerospora sorghi]|uniref:Uncharacterized protein n=1 Tax=Peronosclerospora sorghi TaxID=230839 RepID=A0ACC0WH56_9STRA|nr:hypothetical protein PsorP6_013400 [Peronosclerospora sorghi]